MEKDVVGYRFHPTGEELINHYLKNKILGKTWLVEDVIKEINICSYDPKHLPSISKIGSKDLVWYFFSPREYTTSKKTIVKRTTPSGFWKATGKDRKIKNKRGNGVEIGIKKTLVYHHGKVPNGVWTPWVMHEYHITCLPLRQRTYVICQVMYKGDEGDTSFGNSSTETKVEKLNHMSLDDLLIPMTKQEELSIGDDGFDPNTFFSESNNHNNPNLQPETPHDNEYWSRLLSYNGGDFEDVFFQSRTHNASEHEQSHDKETIVRDQCRLLH